MPRSFESDMPFLGPRQAMNLQEFSRKPTRSSSHTFGELLQRIGDSTTTSLSHQVVDVPSSVPLLLSFHNLTYSVRVGRSILPTCFTSTNTEDDRMKVLLNDISGEARDGKIMVVLGASGSGKSTLIDALANRIARESLKGSITLNGEALESKLLKVISGYVMQDDLLFPMLTVEETLMFSTF